MGPKTQKPKSKSAHIAKMAKAQPQQHQQQQQLVVVVVVVAIVSLVVANLHCSHASPTPNTPNNQLANTATANQNHLNNYYAPATANSQLQNAQAANTFNPYTKAINELLLDLRQQFLNRAFTFDEHFRRLVTASKISLHNMFKDTYGTHYDQNMAIFTGMFNNFEQYYSTGQININHQTISSITKSMEHFFDKLYQIIFKFFSDNSARPTTPGFLECATEQLAHLRPFRDIPDKLIDEIRHAFVAARTFNQALNLGIDVIKSIISIGQPTQCGNLINEKLLKPQSLTQAVSQAKFPCVKYCEDVITRCMGRSNLDELSDKWRIYVMLLNDLALKLSTTYNIETIISPLDIQISEVIMNIQDNGLNITEYVSRACRAEAAATAVPNSIVAPATGMAQHQQPMSTNPMHYSSPNGGRPLARRLTKRAAPSSSRASASASVSRLSPNMHRLAASLSPTNSAAVSPVGYAQSVAGSRARAGAAPVVAAPSATAPYLLQHTPPIGGAASHATATGSYLPGDLTSNGGPKPPLVIEEIRNYLQTTKLFFSTLPNAVCTSNTTLGLNASAIAVKAKPPNCFQEPLTTDLNADFKYRLDINRQSERLDDMRTKIEQALRGEEIDWTVQTAATGSSHSGSGAIGAPVNQQQQLQSSHRLVPSNGRPLLSTTTTTPEPSDDDTEPTDEVSSEEDGSGDDMAEHGEESDNIDSDLNNGDGTNASFDLDEEDDTTSENPATESTDTNDESNAADNNGNSNANEGVTSSDISETNDQTLTTTKTPVEKVTDQNSLEDDSLVTLSPNDLVTVEAGMHKSSGRSSKLVISYRDQILFVMLTCIVVLLVVASFRASRHKVMRLLKSKFEAGVESK